jgi:hypothetical protein
MFYNFQWQFLLLDMANFRRFLCGPGLQLNYQPGTSDGANPSIVAAVDWPIAFPDFKGNVWGPYDTPGDRFQKFGLQRYTTGPIS